MSLVPLPCSLVPFLKPYLPKKDKEGIFVTLTWAQSLDSRIAAAHGTRTKISHPETKTMTHYLRAYHDAILVGVGTVLADDPKLTCRYGNFSKIRPVVLDPNCRWKYSESTLAKLCQDNLALAPYVLVKEDAVRPKDESDLLQAHGGFYRVVLFEGDHKENWNAILHEIHACGIGSVMIEGGSAVVNSLLLQGQLVDTVIVTIGPIFLGKNGVEVAPLSQVKLTDVAWWSGERDGVMAAKLHVQATKEDSVK